MKKNIISLAIIILIAAAGALIWINTNNKSISTLSIKGKKFNIEEANSIEERTKGLSGRKELCSHCGMLFLFPEKGKYGFWMKGMNFSLDIIWIDGNSVVYIEKNISKDNLKTMISHLPADKVLELNAGTVDSLDLHEGDIINYY